MASVNNGGSGYHKHYNNESEGSLGLVVFTVLLVVGSIAASLYNLM